MNEFLVCVNCLTYNHSAYIRDAMNGFCMQQTDFPFVCVIVDDASTDGNQDVIKAYLAEHFDLDDSTVVRNEETENYYLTFARHKTNQNCHFAVHFLKENHFSIRKPKTAYFKEWYDKARYIAICEGDDYWTAPFKLQKQVDFLESHPDYSLIFHGVKQLIEETKEYKDWTEIENRDYSGNEIIKTWTIATGSSLFRSVMYDKVPKNPKFQYGDNILWLTCAIHGKLRGMKDVMGIYRRHKAGWTRRYDRTEMTLMQLNHFKAVSESFSIYPEFDSIKNAVNLQILGNSLHGFWREYQKGGISTFYLSHYLRYMWSVDPISLRFKHLYYFLKNFLYYSLKHIKLWP